MVKRVRQIRMSRGWSQAALARKAELNQTTVCNIETGRMVPYPSQLAKVARALGWPGDPGELLKDVNDDDCPV